MSVLVGRPIYGIPINGLEYILDDEGNEMWFENEATARSYLKNHEIIDEAIEELGIIFENEEGELI